MLASTASMTNCSGLAIDAYDNLYIADRENHVVRMVASSSNINELSVGNIYTFAGTMATSGYSGDGDSAKSSLLNTVWGIAVDTLGDLFIGDSGNNVIRKVTGGYTNGIITTYFGSYGSSICSLTTIGSVVSLAVDSYYLYVCDQTCGSILKVEKTVQSTYRKRRLIQSISSPTTSPTQSTASYYAGGGDLDIGILSGLDAEAYRFENVFMTGISVYNNNDVTELYLAGDDGSIRYIRDGIIYTLYSSQGYCIGDCPRLVTSATTYNHPYGITVDTSGTVYFADRTAAYVLKVFSSPFISYNPTYQPTTDPTQSLAPTSSPTAFYLSIIAGVGLSGYSDDGSLAISSSLAGPTYPAVDSFGQIYFCDVDSFRVRKFIKGL